MTVNITKITHCRCCESNLLNRVIDFNETAIADDYFQQGGNEKTYPLACMLCDNCGLLQLEYVVDASAIYDDYIYVCTSSPGLNEHFRQYAQQSSSLLSLNSSSKVLDVGCNDGMLLKHFQSLHCQVVGIEPSAPIAEALNEYGIKTFNGYLTSEVADSVLAEVGQFDLVSSNNVFANVHDITTFANAVAKLLNNDGVWIIETVSHLSLIENFVFDNIYHEHLSYFSITSLQYFFKQFDMQVFHVDKVASKGGSIRVYASFINSRHLVDKTVIEHIKAEHNYQLFSIATYHAYIDRISQLKSQVEQQLLLLKKQGNKIVGFGASATVTTVLYVLGIAKYLDYLVDDNIIKQQTYSPGFRLPVYSSQQLEEESACCVVILPWRFADMFIEKNLGFLHHDNSFLKIIPQVCLVHE